MRWLNWIKQWEASLFTISINKFILVDNEASRYFIDFKVICPSIFILVNNEASGYFICFKVICPSKHF